MGKKRMRAKRGDLEEMVQAGVLRSAAFMPLQCENASSDEIQSRMPHWTLKRAKARAPSGNLAFNTFFSSEDFALECLRGRSRFNQP